MIFVVGTNKENALLTKNTKFICNYNRGNYEQIKLKMNKDFVKKIEQCVDFSDQHLLLESLHYVINKHTYLRIPNQK